MTAHRGCEYETTWRTEKDGTRTCTYCGSLHPEDFVDILYGYIERKEGYYFSTTDKGGWKYYANLPGCRNAGDGGMKFYGNHATDEWRERVEAALGLAIPVFRAQMQERYGAQAGRAI